MQNFPNTDPQAGVPVCANCRERPGRVRLVFADGEGRTVDFTNTVIVMTSNLGAGKARRGLGFTAGEPAAEDERMLSAAKDAFLPEVLNRIDEIVSFQPLTAGQVEQIAHTIVARVADRLRSERGIELEVDDALTARLARDGFDEAFGAGAVALSVLEPVVVAA